MKRKMCLALARAALASTVGICGIAYAGGTVECTQYDESCTSGGEVPRIETIVVEAYGYIEGGNVSGFDIYNLIYYEYPDYNTGEVSHTGWNDPAYGRCGNEIETFSKLAAANAAWMATASNGLPPAGPPPGRLIMTGPFDDPAFQGPGWGKYDYEEIFRVTYTGTGTTTRYVVHIHQMVNTVTGFIDQIRLNSTYQSGCVGSSTTGT